MNRVVVVSSDTRYRPSRWRWFVIALGAIILCSCKAIDRDRNVDFLVADRSQQFDEPPLVVAAGAPSQTRTTAGALAPIVHTTAGQQITDKQFAEPRELRTAQLSPPPPASNALDADSGQAVTQATTENGGFDPADLKRDDTDVQAWVAAPTRCCPNCVQPWGQPRDEYLCDGADSGAKVRVSGKDFSIRSGLDPADTIGHFDTLAGKRVVAASTRACLYAPRFAAARKIVRVELEQLTVGADPLVGHSLAVTRSENTEVGQVKLPEAVENQVAHTIGYGLEQHDPARLQENVLGLQQTRRKLLPFENLEVVKSGLFSNRETTFVQEGTDAAVAWSSAVQPQVILQDMPAFVSQANVGGQEVLLYEVQPGEPQLRLVKLASRGEAQPGESVHFTIRFDNTGNEEIGNVTIIDNLPARLEYVDGTADCSAKHAFASEPNNVGSQTLRFEITDPLEPGHGGVVRFRCLVR